MRIVEAAEARERLTMDVCIPLMREALVALESGQATQPPRSICALPHDRSFGFMPAYMGDGDCLGAKVITAFPQNAGTEYPSHMGYVMIFEAEHGSFVGMADCSVVTEVRTGAVSGVATDLLARKDAHVVGMVGAGAQARSHLAAMMLVRPAIDEVRVYDIRPEAAAAYAAEMSAKYGVEVKVCGGVEQAVRDADIICTVTPSKEAYLPLEWVKPGAHVNAVGTFSPSTREVCSDLVAASKLYGDQVEATRRESGEYLVPLAEGLIGEDHIVGSIGDILLGRVPGRESDDEITMFDALGLAVEDVICGRYLVCGEKGQE
jgi:ornithine cyclodeaminase/alanine dehydrogenase-like protein (mu-crystallin family)